MAKYDDRGREVPDPTPVAIPVGISRPLTLREEMMRFIRSPEFAQEMSRQRGDQVESFQESDDFEVDDPEDFVDVPTSYEMSEDQERSPNFVPPQAPSPGASPQAKEPGEVPPAGPAPTE